MPEPVKEGEIVAPWLFHVHERTGESRESLCEGSEPCVKSRGSETTELSLLWLLKADQPAAPAGKHR